MRVGDPGQGECYGGEDYSCQEDPEVPHCNGFLGREQDVADCSYETRACDEGTADPDSVREESRGDNYDEAEYVRRGGETVALDGGESTHFGDDGWDEERQGSEADVAAEVDEWRDVGAVVEQSTDGLLPLEFIGCAVTGLAEGDLDCYLAVAV